MSSNASEVNEGVVECPFCRKEMSLNTLNDDHERAGMHLYWAEGRRRQEDYARKARAFTALATREAGAEAAYAVYSQDKKTRRIDCPFCNKSLLYDKTWRGNHTTSCKPLALHRQQSEVMAGLDFNGPYGQQFFVLK
jgi:uncharacterized Zn-finger protein